MTVRIEDWFDSVYRVALRYVRIVTIAIAARCSKIAVRLQRSSASRREMPDIGSPEP
jgi:hypothetical protein